MFDDCFATATTKNIGFKVSWAEDTWRYLANQPQQWPEPWNMVSNSLYLQDFWRSSGFQVSNNSTSGFTHGYPMMWLICVVAIPRFHAVGHVHLSSEEFPHYGDFTQCFHGWNPRFKSIFQWNVVQHSQEIPWGPGAVHQSILSCSTYPKDDEYMDVHHHCHHPQFVVYVIGWYVYIYIYSLI